MKSATSAALTSQKPRQPMVSSSAGAISMAIAMPSGM